MAWPWATARISPASTSSACAVADFTRDQIHDIRRAYRLLFADEGTLSERVEDVAEEFATHPFVHEILDFIREGKDRAICTPRDPVSSN